MRRFILAALAIVILVTASSCNDSDLAKATLVPSVNIVKHKDADDRNSTVCLFSACPYYGTGCAISSSIQSSQVGYSYYYDPGTQPCACWHYHNCAWRSYFKFDLNTLPSKKVVDAVLHFKADKIHDAGSAEPPGFAACTVKLYLANQDDIYGQYTVGGDYLSTFTLNNAIQGGAGLVVDAQIGPIVQKWVKGLPPNHGLFLVGPDESLAPKTNKECWVELSDISLKVTVNMTP